MRESLDVFFMKIAFMYATRSTCIRRQVGSVIVYNKNQIAAGYNGALSGEEHCSDNPDLCIRTKLNIPSGERQELCRAVHSEQSAIAQAVKHGICLNNATIYITHKPCVNCAKLIVASGIKRIVYCGDYGSSNDNKICDAILNTIQVDILDRKDFIKE